MRLGPFTVSVHEHWGFRLDGGAMFGSVPKALWERLCPPDERNRIPMAARSLVVQDEIGRKLMVDAGCGDCWPEKFKEIFAIPEGPYEPVPGVTDVLLTHLHFDHAGGVVRASVSSNGGLEPSYPSALHHVSAANLANAKNPNPRERASYLPEILDAISQVKLSLIELEPLPRPSGGEDSESQLERAGGFARANLESWPGLVLHRADGHTRGLQWLELSAGGHTVAFPSDLFPTSHHLPAHFTMGYDMCAEVALGEKRSFLERAINGNWIVVFQHDPDVPAARLKWDERGRPVVSETVDFGQAGE